jgi:hypothetical protein
MIENKSFPQSNITAVKSATVRFRTYLERGFRRYSACLYKAEGENNHENIFHRFAYRLIVGHDRGRGFNAQQASCGGV